MDVVRSSTTSKHSVPSNSSGSSTFSRDRGYRSLSRTEWEDRRKKGLCYRCGQQYGPAHKCPEGKLRILLLGDDEDVVNEGEHQLLESEVPTGDHDTQLSGTCLTLEFEGLLAETGGVKTLRFEGTLYDIPINILVDSGATHNFISRGLVLALGLPISSFSGISIKLGDGHSVVVTERCLKLPIQVGSAIFFIDALVFETATLDVILGMAWLHSLGEVIHDWQHSWMKFLHKGKSVMLQGNSFQQPLKTAFNQWLALHEQSFGNSQMVHPLPTFFTLSPEQHADLSNLLTEFATIFMAPTGLPPPRSHDHSIILTSNDPICVRPYRYPHVQKSEIERQVKELLDLGMIQHSKSAYSSPVILVRKKDNSWPMCVDYRALNKATVPDKFPIPVVDELLDELHGAQFFSKLDLKSGYNQIRMSPASIEKTTFRTHDGHYEYLVMPFGLMNAPATFQAVMNDVFRPLLRTKVVIFFDDILVYSSSWTNHMADLRLVFSILLKHHFMVNKTKCSFGQPSVEYLGHIIDAQGVSMDPKKIEVVLSWPVPTQLKGLRGFLGLTGYYRKFIKNYGSIARPLTDLTKKDAFCWHPGAQAAFEQLKQALVSAPVLTLPDFKQPFMIECDASGRGIGAVLMQNRKPIAYFSKALSDRNLSKSAGSLLQTNRIWVAKLLGYNFDIHYKPGRENRAADALSRSADVGEFVQAISSPVWLQGAKLIEEAQADKDIQDLKQKYSQQPTKYPEYSIKQGVLHYRNRVVIPRTSAFIPLLLQEFHTTPSGGHSGFYRTYRRLAANLYWPGMTGSVKQFVRECDVCQRCKSSSLSPGGLLQPLDIPEAIWENLSMDFIVGLPTSKGFNVILVVVDRLSKYAHFLLLRHPYTAKTVAEVFVKDVIRHHGVPKSIVSDRDPLFLSKFWKEIFHSMGTKLHMSSAYHPESDGQTEVINRCLQAYLRCFAIDQPKNWALWLPWAEFWYNSTFHASTGTTPFEVVYGHRPPSILQFIPGEVRVESVARELQDRDEALRQLKVHLSNAQSTMKLQADKHRRDVQFMVGDWVYVKLKPYRQFSVSQRIHQKLAAKFFGPFQIIEKIGPVAYRLHLPPTSKIHPVFHVALLKKAVRAPTDTHLPPDLCIDNNDTPIPIAVIAKRVLQNASDSVEQWLIQWQHQDSEDATWEDKDWVLGQFPDASLEDKTLGEGGGNDTNGLIDLAYKDKPKIVHVYARRGKVDKFIK
ncbi:hypothetical protein E3N88_38039 [Mikania micrantha]|uniref:Integrase catalytic domain-containing protein n=1 Tax=Mikania micrantha TaxID=192012 RepID=A0A5N6LVA6_9ASTR|nr:hypothetical protein E3N88_38039 [Mikania micrantha]